MNSPFYQPARQNFSSSQNMQQPQSGFGGFGGYQGGNQTFGGQGFGGGFNPFQGGFGGGSQGFGGFGGNQGFSPFQGGFGGGQGFGGSQGFGGFGGGMQQGFNPMFGGIGGLGFNPMMGPQFGMPMQGFGGGFNPYQQQQFNPYQQRPQQQSPEQLQEQYGLRPYQQPFAPQKPPGNNDSQFDPNQDYGQPVMGDMMYRGGPQMSPQMRQQREQDMRQMERMATPPVEGEVGIGKFMRDQTSAINGGTGASPFTGPKMTAQDILEMAVKKRPGDMQYDLNKDGKITSADALAYQRQYGQQPAAAPAPTQVPYAAQQNLQQQRQMEMMRQQQMRQRQQPMFGGIGGLGFNPMMGRNFGMPMGGFNRGMTMDMRPGDYGYGQMAAYEMGA